MTLSLSSMHSNEVLIFRYWFTFNFIQLTLVVCIEYELKSFLNGKKPLMNSVFAIKSDVF